MHFAKFPILRFSKHHSFNSFHHNSAKLHTKYHNQGLYRLLHFLDDVPKIILWHFEIFVSTGRYRAGNSKRYPYNFHPMSAKFMTTLLTTGECQLLLFLAIDQVLKQLWQFEILTLESMGNLKMWNISKTNDRTAKWTEIWDSGYYSSQIEVTFDAGFLEFGLESFGILCKISNFTIFKTLLLTQFSSDSSKLYTGYPYHGAIQAITIFGDLPKIKKSWHFDFFS